MCATSKRLRQKVLSIIRKVHRLIENNIYVFFRGIYIKEGKQKKWESSAGGALTSGGGGRPACCSMYRNFRFPLYILQFVLYKGMYRIRDEKG